MNSSFKKNLKLKNRIKPSKLNPILQQIEVISCLKALREKFFFIFGSTGKTIYS